MLPSHKMIISKILEEGDKIFSSCFTERERTNGCILLGGGTAEQGPADVAVAAKDVFN